MAMGWVSEVVHFNALMNVFSTCSLCLGGYFIFKGRRLAHQRAMLFAFGFSTLFLIGYLLYHYFHGSTLYTGAGWIRGVYFFVLISHIILTIVALPLILWSFFRALTGDFVRHKRVARITFPIWLYVSVSGLVVYGMLHL